MSKKHKPQDRKPPARGDAQGIFREALRHHQSGRIADAVAHYERALTLKPDYPDAHNNLGVALAAQGRIDDALAHYERTLALQPDHPDAHSNRGVALAARGRFEEAIAHYERALAVRPDYADAHYNLGLALAAQGRFGDAVAHYQRALALKPDSAGVHNNLGIALAALGRTGDAVAHYQRALVLQPEYPDAHNNLGVALAAQGRIGDALAHYERTLALQPGHAEAHNNLGIVLAAQGRIDDARAHYERALALRPAYPDAHNNLGVVLVAQGQIDKARAHYETALALKPGYAGAHNNLGIALATQGRVDDALTEYGRALAINPDYAETYNNLGNLFKDQGNFDEALKHYRRAIAIRPDYAEAHFNRAATQSFHAGDADLAALESLAAHDDLSVTQALHVHFALAKAFEDCRDYPQAWEHLRTGNAIKRRNIVFDEAQVENRFRRIAAVFDSALFDRLQGAGNPSPVPIFVVGMPRSGSTLIEQILASHPQIHGAGELPGMELAAGSVLDAAGRPVPYPEYAPALNGAILRQLGQYYLASLPAPPPGKTRIVDKMPDNFLRIGLIRLVLPHARIIHTMRDPIDTCVSCFSKLFASGLEFSYDLEELGRFYRRYSALMTHWRSVVPADALLDVSYEDVVDDLEGQARRLIDYCGLPWDDGCVSFHRTSRPVKTASNVQVRQPLFRSSLQRWRKYEAGLHPLLRELGDLVRPSELEN